MGLPRNHQTYMEFQRSADVAFMSGFEAAESVWPLLADMVPSKSDSESFIWTDGVAKPRKWTGARVVHGLLTRNYRVEHDVYELTVGVPRAAFDDDKLGLYLQEMKEIGESLAQLPDDILEDTLAAAFTTEGPDGQMVIDTDHPNGDGVYPFSNKLTRVLDTQSLDQCSDTFGAIKLPNGRPGKKRMTHLLVPEAYRETGRRLVQMQKLANGADNPNFNRFGLIVVPGWPHDGGAIPWGGVSLTSATRKVLRFFERDKVESVVRADVKDPHVFDFDEIVAGGRWRGSVAWGRPENIVMSDGTMP